MTDNNESKKKAKDLTGGAYQPKEQFKELPDGTVVRLEDPTMAKTQEEIEKEAKEQTEDPGCQTTCQITNQISDESE